jgi:phage gpG-like protein
MALALQTAINVTRPPRISRDAFLDAMARALALGMNDVKRRAILNLTGRFLRVRSGRLRSSIQTRIIREANAVIGQIGTNVVYARIHEFGGTTRPHTILPRRATVLRFQRGGKTIFARRVNHPGSKFPERPFLRTALDESRGDIVRHLRAALGQLLEGSA